MLHNWFECKVKFEKTMENGMQKKVSETYIVDALSFTEAEAHIIEEVTPFISGEYQVSDIKRAKYAEIMFSKDTKDDCWFKAKLTFVTLDEKSGGEKKTSSVVLVQACDLREAVKKVDQNMKGSMSDYTISSLTETAVMDVYPYEAAEDSKKSNNERRIA